MTFSEFLLARISDQEKEIRRAAGFCESVSDYKTGRLLSSMLAEVEAKRRIVALHKPVTDGGEWFCDMLETGDESTWPCMTARLLALPYAKHNDYRDEWRP